MHGSEGDEELKDRREEGREQQDRKMNDKEYARPKRRSSASSESPPRSSDKKFRRWGHGTVSDIPHTEGGLGEDDVSKQFEDKRIGFPLKKPGEEFMFGWFFSCHRITLHELIERLRPKVVVELGSYLGLSTLFMSDLLDRMGFSETTLYAIDLWDNRFLLEDLKYHYGKHYDQLSRHDLYRTFLSNLWKHRSRVRPMRMDTIAGLRTLAKHGVKPDLIYIDADHTYAPAKRDIETCLELFPDAVLVGDDYDYGGVERALKEIIRERTHLAAGSKRIDKVSELHARSESSDLREYLTKKREKSDSLRIVDLDGKPQDCDRSVNREAKGALKLHVEGGKCWTFGEVTGKYRAEYGEKVANDIVSKLHNMIESLRRDRRRHSSRRTESPAEEEIIDALGSLSPEEKLSALNGLCRGKTLLMLAVKRGLVDIVEFLVRQPEIDVNVPDTENSFTALHIAAYGGDRRMVDLLLQKGADVFAKNAFRETPADAARAARQLSIVEVLRGAERKKALA